MSKPRLAILGAGPTGLEAALAAAERGLPFTLYEQADEVAAHVRAWGHVRLFSPWSLDVSPRMRAALEGAGHDVPDDGACPSGDELVERVFAPLAALPALAPHLRLGTRVVSVGREGLLKHEEISSEERGRRPFRLLIADAEGHERVERADVVLDCTGTYSNPNALGDGGIPAPGERALDGRIVRTIPDVASEAAEWAGREILLLGGGHSAQTAAVALAELAAEHDGTRVVWALRRPAPSWSVDPDDPLPERARLTTRARSAVESDGSGVEPVWGVVVEALRPAGERIAVTLRSHDGSTREIEVDRVLSLTGYVGDAGLYRQLQVHECYATSGPMNLSAALLAAGGEAADCLDQESHGVDTLVNPEPGFFLLGAKSYGRNNTFLMRVGWQQVDEVLSLLD
ncbi:MAG: FAD-dependent oxidoreductase [Thermoanaerobaculia bacterium]